jgi:predicted nuclease of predicted toxin-antitoxin system
LTRAVRRFLADANVDPDVVEFLRTRGHDAVHVREVGLAQADDARILRHAVADRRIVVTHDGDFGRLAVVDGVPFVGIVFLRPGHIDPAFTMNTLDAVLAMRWPKGKRFLIVAKRRGHLVGIRVRFAR